MSTKYFILTKSNDSSIDNNDENQILFLNKTQTFILPQINLPYYLNHGLFENRLMKWCEQFSDQNKNMLDIGAHTGTYSLYFSRYYNKVHSFEPQRMTYYALCGGVALSGATNVTCHNFGLGNAQQAGTQTLKIVSDDGGGSSLHNSGSGILREENIEIKTLDSLNLENIAFIKMDVEENELPVLQGGVETIKRSNFPPIIFEYNSSDLNSELFLFIEKLGYKFTPIKNCGNMYLAYLEK